MRATGTDRSPGVTGLDLPFLVGVAQRDADATVEHVERVFDLRVAMPRDLLGGTDAKLRDPKTRALRMVLALLDIEVVGIGHGASPQTRLA
jgi:hypothetical protein